MVVPKTRNVSLKSKRPLMYSKGRSFAVGLNVEVEVVNNYTQRGVIALLPVI